MAIPATPATTPPAIAPTGVECVATVGRPDDDTVGELDDVTAEEGVPIPEVVSTAMRSKTNLLVSPAEITVMLIL